MKLSFLKNKEAQNAGWIIGGKIIQMVLSLFIGVLSARYLGPGNYGLINYGTAFVSFFTALCTLGLNSIIVKDFIDHPDEQGKALGSTILMQLMSSLLSVAMIMGIVGFLDRGEPMTIAVVFLCCIGSVFHVFDTVRFWFQAQYKSKIHSMASLIAYVVVSIYRILLLISQKDVRWFAMATSIDYIVVAIFLGIVYKKYNGPKLSVSLTKSKALLKNSYHYLLSGLMVALYGQTDKLMIKHLMGETDVGYYSTALAVCNMWTFILQAIIDSIYPTILSLYNKDKNAFNKKNRQLYAIVFYTSLFVSVMFILFGDLAIRILYGEQYVAAAAPLKVISWYTSFSYLGVARNAWMVCNHKQKYLKYMYVFAAIMNIALNCLMIPTMGTVGAALASVITQMFTSIILPLFFKEIRPNAKLMLEAIILKDVFQNKKINKEI